MFSVSFLCFLFPVSLHSPLQTFCLDKHTCPLSYWKTSLIWRNGVKHRDISGWGGPESISKWGQKSYRGAVPSQPPPVGNGTRRDAPGWWQHQGPGNSLGTWGLREVVGSQIAPQEGSDPLPRAPQGAVCLAEFIYTKMRFAKESKILPCFSCHSF